MSTLFNVSKHIFKVYWRNFTPSAMFMVHLSMIYRWTPSMKSIKWKKKKLPDHVFVNNGVKCKVASKQRRVISRYQSWSHFHLLSFKGVLAIERVYNKMNITTVCDLTGLYCSRWFCVVWSNSRLRFSWYPTKHEQLLFRSINRFLQN